MEKTFDGRRGEEKGGRVWVKDLKGSSLHREGSGKGSVGGRGT